MNQEDKLREAIKNIVEELCAKGKAYRKKRMAAGEKSSAYLSGRAVKVCKGQIKGENTINEFVGKELEARNEPLFNKLVAGQGKSETVEGEMLRAINRIAYRYYNDGDKYFQGYGTETAGPAHSFLVNANHPLKSAMNRIFNEPISDSEYEQMIKDALDMILDYIESRQGKYTPNNVGDIFDYEPEFEDDEEDYDDYDYDDEDDYMQESALKKSKKEKIMKISELKKLIRKTIKEADDAAMKKSALGMAMYGKKAKMNEEAGEVNVFGYQTQHFDICPGAQSLYKAIVDGEHGKQDKDLVIRVAKLHDSLFYMEKLAKDGKVEVTQELVDIAQNQADLIMSAAKEKMDLEKEHSYVQGHVDTIKGLMDGETMDEAKKKSDDEEGVADNTEFKLTLKHLLDKHVVKGGLKKVKDGSKK
jgi:hypothetical protein